MRLVYVGIDGGLYTWRRGDACATCVTCEWEEVDVRGARTRLRYSWPCLSPDGRRVLTLAQRGGERHVVHLVDADGVSAQELVAFDDGTPIYANWSPTGDRVAVLVRRRETLALELFDLAAPSAVRVVARGAPLFWSWAPDGTTLAVHAGESASDLSSGGTFLVDTASGAVRHVLSDVQALFRVPSWSPDGRLVAFARSGADGTHLVLVDPESGERQSRTLARGPIAFVWHPRLPVLAYAVASDEAPHVYRRVVMLDLGGDREWALAGTALAFFWHPERRALFRLAIDDRRDRLSWELGDGTGAPSELTTFLPTREVVFAASFFDQFALSHAPIAPDGSAVAVAGRLREEGQGERARVYHVPADGQGAIEIVGDGLYAVWGR